ncbi:hypothetical protein [Streptomyces violaceus]|uniref:Uncharacterized protein n=1 Tax=Streptomyces violaceus TaxID=1936 RepID=A0ABY9UPH1_STRVL|nr:hypothetical protein [Streptomyces janthinus]WND24177.1 hypothetical protein RI060_43435 [Streptomyces janthinus]GGS96620.1 hypothetical protein GCM10010270_80730 [Streptomyces janthinus]
MTDDTVTAARVQATRAWTLFTQERNLRARIPDWRTTTSADGVTTLSVEVAGPGAAHALRLFASQYHLVLGQPGDQRPTFDYTTPGRTACVWRSSGVWVELWHPDTVAHLPAAPVTHQAPRRGLLSRASDRLPYTRRTTAKENTTS